jgi:hypothetical protein
MLQITDYLLHPLPPSPQVWNGDQLELAALGGTPTISALLAADLVEGLIHLRDLTEWQACMITGASYGYLRTTLNLGLEERDHVRRGLVSLSRKHRARTQASADRPALLAQLIDAAEYIAELESVLDAEMRKAEVAPQARSRGGRS